jgi:hypothetical protein
MKKGRKEGGSCEGHKGSAVAANGGLAGTNSGFMTVPSSPVEEGG